MSPLCIWKKRIFLQLWKANCYEQRSVSIICIFGIAFSQLSVSIAFWLLLWSPAVVRQTHTHVRVYEHVRCVCVCMNGCEYVALVLHIDFICCHFINGCFNSWRSFKGKQGCGKCIHTQTHARTHRWTEGDREIYANTQRIVIFFSGTAVFFFLI